MSTQSSSESSDVRWTSRMVVEFEKTFDPSVGGSNKSVYALVTTQTNRRT